MSIFDWFLSDISPASTIPQIYNYIISICTLISLIPIFWHSLKITRIYFVATGENRDFIRPNLIAILGVYGLALSSFLVSIIKAVSDSTKGLRFDTFIRFIFFFLILSSLSMYLQKIIKIPRYRQRRTKSIKVLLRVTLFIFLVVFTYNIYISVNSSANSPFLEYLAYFLMLLASLLMLSAILVLRAESHDNTSKLMKIRINMIILGFLPITIIYLLLPVFITSLIMFVGHLEMLIILQIIWGIITPGLRVLSSFGLYWIFFTPEWIKNRFGMKSPRTLSRS